MADHNSRPLKETKKRSFAVGTMLSAIGFAVALALSPFPASASPGHDVDTADHEMDDSCMDHEEMSAEEHDKGHYNGAEDCDMDQDHDDSETGDHQH